MKQKKNNNITKGAGIFYLIISLLFLVLLSRFLYIQVTGKVKGKEVAAYANTPYNSELTLVADRGKIVDRNGKVIAQDTAAYTVVAILDKNHKKDGEPWYIDDPDNVAEKLSSIIDMKKEQIYSLLTDVEKDRKQVELGPGGRGISIKKKKQIEALNIPGITFVKDKKRYYPNGDFASYIVGYTKVAEKQTNNESKYVGAMGVEKQYDALLQEKNGSIIYERDASGNRLPFGKREVIPAEQGATVALTIDHTIQAFLEESMKEMVEKYNPKKAIAIVMNPKTGEILALSNAPSFDPNKKNITNFYNDAISYPYEPGSTMKIFTLAAAIEEGVWDGDDTFQSGSYAVAGSRSIRDHNQGIGWGEITYLEGIQRSSNVAMATIVDKILGAEKFYEYLDKFGFYRKTGIDLPGEITGSILNNYKIERLTTAFGQGSTVTAMQQMAAASAIANDGKMVTPYVIKNITDNEGNIVKETKTNISGYPISKETAKEVRSILETVVTSPKGTGNAYKIKGYSVAGKTGTAQIPNPDGGGYISGHGDYIYSFLGMAPADNPELVMYVGVEKPNLDGMETGSEPVAAVFNSVMKNSLQYLKVKPSKKTETNSSKVNSKFDITVPDVSDLSVKEAEKMLKDVGLVPVVVGDGKRVKSQLTKKGTEVLKGEKIIIETTGKAIMPKLKGWSLRDVQKLALHFDLKLEVSGNGYVVTQNKKAGSKLKKGDLLSVELKRATEKTKAQKIEKVEGPMD